MNTVLKHFLAPLMIFCTVLAIPPSVHADDDLLEGSVLDTDTNVPITTGGVGVAGVGAAGLDSGFGDQVGTATGDILEGRGELAKDRGKAMLYKALSAEQLQQAFDQQLDNRRESVKTYFELRDLNDKERQEDGYQISSEDARENAKSAAPDRLTDAELDAQSGQVNWPGPLASKTLKPYRRPIEDSFAKRSSPGEDYGKFDFYRVQRMVNFMQEAIDSIDDELAAREAAALKQYLKRVAYEARFNSAGERVDY